MNQPITLPSGAVIKNRICKAAMTERLAIKNNASKQLINLYRFWANSGAGLIISGNIMVDKRYKEAAANLVIENDQHLDKLKELTKAATANGTHFWAQISHGGRQSSIFSTFKPVAPSAVQLKKLGLFAKPRALKTEEAEEIIQKYINAAAICKNAGFTGIQIHAAHGYLISQFLSPITNKRSDKYGGDIQGRATFLLEVIDGCKKALGEDYPISVKLNSADFQKGGFDEKDALYVIKELEKRKIDLLEISGGTYDNIAFFNKNNQRESTRAREAYFLDFAKSIREQSAIPLMVTGGFRTAEFCNEVLENKELDMIGFGRPFLVDRTFPQPWLDGHNNQIKDVDYSFNIKQLKDMAEAGFFDYQIHRIAANKELNLSYSPFMAVLRMTKNEMLKGWFKL